MRALMLTVALALAGCTAGEAAAPAATSGRHLVVTGTDRMRFDPPSVQVRAGETVTLTLKNDGSLLHDLVTQGASLDAVIASVPGGRQKSAPFRADTPGTYRIVCPQPGHTDAGMVGQVVVTASQ
jgi:uncharacterized cupredoxin-like copper-binding protein